MENANSSLETLQDIRSMMERSSRFISLSGWSGVAAGCCALVGAWFARDLMLEFRYPSRMSQIMSGSEAFSKLMTIAVITLVTAFVLAFFFTYVRSLKLGVPIWGGVARNLVTNASIPMLAGGAIVLRLLVEGNFSLALSCSLIVYGIALFCASKQMVSEIRYLSYFEMLLGVLSICVPGWSLIAWALGFGVLHIVYGILMWFRHERKSAHEQ